MAISKIAKQNLIPEYDGGAIKIYGILSAVENGNIWMPVPIKMRNGASVNVTMNVFWRATIQNVTATVECDSFNSALKFTDQQVLQYPGEPVSVDITGYVS